MVQLMESDCRSKREIWRDRSRLALDGILPPFSLPRRALGYARKLLQNQDSQRPSNGWSDWVNKAARPRILIISGCGGDSRRYRCDHLVETVRLIGGDGIVLSSGEVWPASAEILVKHVDALVFHRVAWTQDIETLLEQAQKQDVKLLFDTDDLVFDTASDPSQDPGVGRFGKGQAVAEQFRTMQQCHHVITSTDYLKSRVEALGLQATTLRNGFSKSMLQWADAAASRRRDERVVLGYASGTPTHDKDFELLEPSLSWLLSNYPHVDLCLMGYIQKPRSLAAFGARVQRRPFVSCQELPQRLKDVDINLAPFSPDSEFSKGKSALKYMEAALVGVPTIASPMPAYVHAIESGRNGWIAHNETQWREHLKAAVEQKELRQKIGACARQTALQEDSLVSRSKVLQVILNIDASKPSNPPEA